MGEIPDDERVFRAFNQRRLDAESAAPAYGSVLVLVILGLYVAFKALDALGYPLSFELRMALEKARSIGLSTRPSTSALPKDDDTKMQSGILSRTFGLNGSSLLQKGVRGVAGALSKAPSDVPPGLGNWDNSCYQNSVIQGMASLPSLHEYLSEATTAYGNLDMDTTNGALYDMITKLNDPSNHGQNFWIRGKLKSMSTFQQQDAQEYYSKILDAMDKEVQQEVKKRRPSDAWAAAAKIAVRALDERPEEPANTNDGFEDPKARARLSPNPLDGLLAQRVGCIKCGYVEGLQLIPFNCVTVSLGRGNTYDIRECLDDYTSLEQIEGVECAKCTLLKNKAALTPLADRGPVYAERLKEVEDALENDDFDDKTLVNKFKILKRNWTQSTKSRQAVIARAPKALVLHVNRSIFDEMSGAMYKNSANVSYPRVLDLDNWCLGGDVTGGQWPRDPTKSMLGDVDAEPVTTSLCQYRLRAAVTHYGSHGNGHYVCYRPHATTPASPSETDNQEVKATGEQWWRFSDDSVCAIPEQQAHQGNIFMLFYERIDVGNPNHYVTTEEMHRIVPMESGTPLPSSDIGMSLEPGEGGAATVPLSDNHELLNDKLALSVDDDDESSRGNVAHSNDHKDDGLASASKPVARLADIVAPPHTTAYPTPPESPSGANFDDTKLSEVGSEDAPSTQLTSDDETAEHSPSRFRSDSKFTVRTALMRTASDFENREGGDRKSPAMVAAT